VVVGEDDADGGHGENLPGEARPLTRRGGLRDGSDPTLYADANPLRRTLRRFAASRPGVWLTARLLHGLDRHVYRLTRGRHTLGALLTGLPVVILTTTGARSGRPRSVPVLGLPASGGIAVIASNFGRPGHPGWCVNLRADPNATVVVSGSVRRVRAVEAEGERRAEIFRDSLRLYPGYAEYERRAPHRRIAVFVLEPVSATT
jgi:deazaflavin-dependent oxidoreductase (nitroreductase family)